MSTVSAQSIYTGGAITLPEVSDHDLIMHFQRNSILCTAETQNTKLAKSYKLYPQYRSAYVALLPADHSGVNVCPRHNHCKTHCIGISAGRNRFDNSIIGKYYRTLYYSRFRSEFIAQLSRELTNFQSLCDKTGRTGAVRLNAFSDIAYEIRHPELFANCPDITFYDYTKIYRRVSGVLPINYHLTFSLVAAEHSFEDIHRIATIENVRCSAVVSKPLYKELSGVSGVYRAGIGGLCIVDGDDHDLTFLRDKGKVLILKDKSRIKGVNPLTYDRTLGE
jgi:hypothetical protein